MRGLARSYSNGGSTSNARWVRHFICKEARLEGIRAKIRGFCVEVSRRLAGGGGGGAGQSRLQIGRDTADRYSPDLFCCCSGFLSIGVVRRGP